MYLFKRASDSIFIFGNTADSECPAGQYRIDPSADRATVSIFHVASNSEIIHALPVTQFLNEAGTAYADFAALKAAYAGFFFRVGATGLIPNVDMPGCYIRTVNRAGYPFAVDRELIIGGFSGAEGIGWENLGGFGPA